MFYGWGMEAQALNATEPVWGASFDDPFENDVWFDDGIDGVEPPDAVDLVVEVSAVMSAFAADRLERVASLRAQAVAAARLRSSTISTEIVERSVRLELAAALRVTEYAAGELLALAEAVVHRYRPLLAALRRAEITEQHASALVGGVDAVAPELRDALLAEGLELARTEPVGSFRRRLRARVEALRARTLDARHAEAVRARRVVVEPADDGMAWLHAFVPAVEARAIHGRLTAVAKQLATADDERRSLDELRADVLCDLLIDGAAPAHPAAVRGIRATVSVTVPALTLLDGRGTGPATVEGIGPIPLARARELCGSATDWLRVLTHPETGMVVSVGRDRYRPPPALRRLARWRAERCMAPGCGMPAARCQIDHTVAWEHGGSTSLRNLAPLCQGHHTIKHHGGWIVRQVDGSGGALEWISPMGRRYVVAPERRVPVFGPSRSEGAGGVDEIVPF